MRRQARSTSDKGANKGNVQQEATTAQIKTEDVSPAEPDGSSSHQEAAVATKYGGYNHISVKTNSQAATDHRDGNGFKGIGDGITVRTSRRKYHRGVKQEPKAVDSPSGLDLDTKPTTKRRRTTRAQENLEPAKTEKNMDPAAKGVTSVGERVDDDRRSVGNRRRQQEDIFEGSDKRTRDTRQQSCKAKKVRKMSKRMVEKAALIVQVMDTLYPDPPIPLNHTDSFTLLCAVLLSAQTTDGQVNEVTKELFRIAPDPCSLSKMSQGQVQHVIRSVGLAPTKAKHLIALSQQLLERFGGKVPGTFEGLQSLPGVGRKTAAVVMAQAFGMPAFPVDTHIHRLALRWGLTNHQTNASKVEEDLMTVFPRETWSKLHLQFIYFGREHCQARSHEALGCPVCSWIKKTGPNAPRHLSDLTCLRNFLASPTPPKKSSKNAIIYEERLLEMEKFRMKMKMET